MDSEIFAAQTVRLKAISLKLKSFNGNQSSLILIENLFFDTLSILRSIKEQSGEEDMLHSLLAVKDNEYKRAQEHYRSVKGAEKAIRQFKIGFKRALDKVLTSGVCSSPVPAI
jgi:hypothetical protein